MSIYVKQSNACQPICRNPEEELNDIRKEVAQLRTTLRTELNDDWFIQIHNYCYVRLKKWCSFYDRAVFRNKSTSTEPI